MLIRPNLSELLAPRLWTPDQGPSGLIVVPPPRQLALVVGGRVVRGQSSETQRPREQLQETPRLRETPGGLVIVSSSRKREPARTIGHPDLASGASVHRGDVLYVSIAEAIYRETRGETVELHFESTEEDNDALRELRVRARNRWENDRLPDGWTRPLPPPPTPKKTGLPEELRALLDEFNTRQQHTHPKEAGTHSDSEDESNSGGFG